MLVRLLPPRPTLRRAVLASVALALVLPAPVADAARDPLAEAEARVTTARRAANEAAERYEEAQTKYWSLEEDIERTRETITTIDADAQAIAVVAEERALEAYKGGNSDVEAILNSDDVLDAMRRNELLDRVNDEGNSAVDRLGAMTEDLHVLEGSLDTQLGDQEAVVAELKQREADMRETLAAAERAEQQLRDRLAREQRAREAEARLRRARRAASSRSGSSGGSGSSIVVVGNFGCPAPGSSFGDSWGAPRSGGRRHQGVDMMAGYGTAVYAVVSGSVSFSSSGRGGNQAWLSGGDGNRYFYAHLQSFVGGSRSVSAGEQIATVGDTGNARGTPHLHFEIHPGGGRAVNPYPTVRSHC
ncbi:MAG: murein hydrolase activator EnvC family protein [Actinomycetota bacterium]